MSSREAFLARVREAVREGNRAGGAPPLPDRGSVGYQGAGADPVDRLASEWSAAGGHFHRAAGEAEALRKIQEILAEINPNRVLLGGGLFIDKMDLKNRLSGPYSVQRVVDLAPVFDREAFFAADLGISAVDQVVAETGTLALATRPDQPRSVSLLVPIHLAIAWREQIVDDLFDLFCGNSLSELPACLSLITGPSKTGDIELKLVTGVHGPGVVHLIVIG